MSTPRDAIIPDGLGPPVPAQTWVIVTTYRAGKVPVIHAYGPYPSRSRAKGVIGRMRHADRERYGDEVAALISYHARKLAPESPISARAGQGTP